MSRCNFIVEGDMVDDVESVDTAEETSEATALVIEHVHFISHKI